MTKEQKVKEYCEAVVKEMKEPAVTQRFKDITRARVTVAQHILKLIDGKERN